MLRALLELEVLRRDTQNRSNFGCGTAGDDQQPSTPGTERLRPTPFDDVKTRCSRRSERDVIIASASNPSIACAAANVAQVAQCSTHAPLRPSRTSSDCSTPPPPRAGSPRGIQGHSRLVFFRCDQAMYSPARVELARLLARKEFLKTLHRSVAAAHGDRDRDFFPLTDSVALPPPARELVLFRRPVVPDAPSTPAPRSSMRAAPGKSYRASRETSLWSAARAAGRKPMQLAESERLEDRNRAFPGAYWSVASA